MTPYFKQFLAPMNIFIDQNKNTGGEMDYAQRKNNDIGESVSYILYSIIGHKFINVIIVYIRFEIL
jgi:hypothetical protein